MIVNRALSECIVFLEREDVVLVAEVHMRMKWVCRRANAAHLERSIMSRIQTLSMHVSNVLLGRTVAPGQAHAKDARLDHIRTKAVQTFANSVLEEHFRMSKVQPIPVFANRAQKVNSQISKERMVALLVDVEDFRTKKAVSFVSSVLQALLVPKLVAGLLQFAKTVLQEQLAKLVPHDVLVRREKCNIFKSLLRNVSSVIL